MIFGWYGVDLCSDLRNSHPREYKYYYSFLGLMVFPNQKKPHNSPDSERVQMRGGASKVLFPSSNQRNGGYLGKTRKAMGRKTFNRPKQVKTELHTKISYPSGWISGRGTLSGEGDAELEVELQC